jgi:L-aminopeptidase/D-esterase-like protein
MAIAAGGGGDAAGEGSIIILLATDAPLLPHQLQRLARRAAVGMARTGTSGNNGSGDIFLAFSTANALPLDAARGVTALDHLPNEQLNPVFAAPPTRWRKAILNAIVAADTKKWSAATRSQVEGSTARRCGRCSLRSRGAGTGYRPAA